ncbi:SgcJ/EcaC family oxidoreductase [Dactylosporangium sp. CA-139066]|uniref:SgcJ/EcaC family oxidoreductase n=1 Tax=Dactylosporangium sp. CA-139066 TaxID=3239930 RepID=UPI003D9453A7
MYDERAVRQVGGAVRDAWNRGDATAYAALFTHDASFVAWNGEYGYGRRAIEAAHRHLFAGPLAGSRMTVDMSEPVRFLQADVAVMVTTGAVTPGAEATGAVDTTGREGHVAVQTYVLVNGDDGWRIAAFHNTRRP